jgi:uncharacterized protein YhaN
MEKRELTSAQKARRKYEDKNKEERQQLRIQFTTSLSKKSYDEITAFLEKHNRTKVDLIWAGYFALMEDYGELRKN